MHASGGRRTWVLGVMGALLAAACGDSGPGQSPPVVAKTETQSGDLQVGFVGQALPNALRVVVTRDGEPAPDVPVTWSTGSGSLDPSNAEPTPAG
jgi:hypothetical protein